MNLSIFSPVVLAAMHNDITKRYGLDDNNDRPTDPELLKILDRIQIELGSRGFYMQYIPASYKLTRQKRSRNVIE